MKCFEITGKRECHPSVFGFSGPVKQKCINVMIAFMLCCYFLLSFFTFDCLPDIKISYKKAFIELRHHNIYNVYLMCLVWSCGMLLTNAECSRISVCVWIVYSIPNKFSFSSVAHFTQEKSQGSFSSWKKMGTSDDAFCAPKYIILLCSKILFYYYAIYIGRCIAWRALSFVVKV